MITWNRFHYARKTIDHLLSTKDDFRLYWWDNGSSDGVAEYISALQDERLVLKHLHDENVMQSIPTQWFLRNSDAQVIGKIDDDTLVPDSWINPIRSAIETNNDLGMVGCWTFWPEDFERNSPRALKKIKQFGAHQILWNIGIGGTAFLMRRELALKYLVKEHKGTAFPIDRERMSADGYFSGWYFPLIWAEHMDDPRSKFCRQPNSNGECVSALSARVRGIRCNKEFLDWIRCDADGILSTGTMRQLMHYRYRRSLVGRIVGKLSRIVSR